MEVRVLILLNLINLISIQSQGTIRWTKFMFIESFDRFEDLSFVSGFTHSVICMQLTKCTWKKRKRVFISGAKHPLRVASLGLLQSHQFISTVNGTCLSYLSAAGCVELCQYIHRYMNSTLWHLWLHILNSNVCRFVVEHFCSEALWWFLCVWGGIGFERVENIRQDIFVTSCWLFVIILLLSLEESFITSKNFNSIGDYDVIMSYR